MWAKGSSARKLLSASELTHTSHLTITAAEAVQTHNSQFATVSAIWCEADCVHGRLKGPEEIQAVFQTAGVDLKQPLVTSCGTGVTASVLALALHQLSPNPQVHDKPSILTLQICTPGDYVGSD